MIPKSGEFQKTITAPRKSENSRHGVEVIVEDLENHPLCPHGPTLLFCKRHEKQKRPFFACSACRDRKQCQFFLWKDELNKISKVKADIWQKERDRYLKGVNHRKMFLVLNGIKNVNPEKRIYCQECLHFIEENQISSKHENHHVIKGISNHDMNHPSEFLPPLDDSRKEAQYLFAKKSVEDLANILKDLDFENIICIGTPRIHEHIRSNYPDMNSILLDFDRRFHNFFGPLEYGWYNFFNNHFFFKEAQLVFEDFLKSTGGKRTILITDPPFGGRIEPLADSLQKIGSLYKKLTKTQIELPVFFIFPYFMETQILNSLPNYNMLDYKVGYDNHPLFQNGAKGRKQGSPVRIFTNLNPSSIKLPEPDYKHCRKCRKWVSLENKHCNFCNSCTSKNGETYVHCEICQKCVKPNWQHCSTCQRCILEHHSCGMVLSFKGACLNCKEIGHKKLECPKLGNERLKRRKNIKAKSNKKKKL